MANLSTVVASETPAVFTQYNNLRLDAIGPYNDERVWNDNQHARFGTLGADGDIYSDGTDLFIDHPGGGNINLQVAGTTRLQITSTGFNLAGDQLFGDNEKVIFGDGSDTSMYWDGTKFVVTPALPITSGGTGAITASAARTALGLAIGSDVQAWDAQLDSLATGLIDGFPIGSVTPSTGAFTDLEVLHTATSADEHAADIVHNAAGFGDSKALDIDYITGALAAGSDTAIALANIDQSLTAGGDITAIEVLATEGSAQVNAVLAGAGVSPIEQLSGSFSDMDSALVNAVDQLAAFISTASDVTLFVADNDTVTIGNASKFEEIEFLFDTVASGSGVKPTFEYSTGSSTWASFTPVDGTNGMRQNGVIAWLDGDIPTWVTGVGSEYLIRITRTQNSLSTSPIEDKVQIAITAEYSWDANADVTIRDLVGRAANLSGNITVGGTVDGVDIAARDHARYTDSEAIAASRTKAQLNTSVSDGTVLYVGDITIYTDAEAVLAVEAEATLTLASGTTIGGQVAATVANLLSDFAATTSAQLAGVISDETGTGSLVFATSPTLVTPALGTPSSGVATNLTGTAAGLTAGNVTTNANLTGHVTSVGNAAVLGSFTKAQLDAAVSDGNVTFDGDITQYTDALAIAAVEGEATLALAGDVSIANLKSLSTNTINETTVGSGVTIDGVLLKDGLVDGVDVAVRDHAKYLDSEAIAAVEGEATLVLSGVLTATSPVLTTPDLGTPSALVGTNITGTAAGLTAGNATLAATVTTNANLTGHVTSVGNAAVLGSFTKAQLSAAVSDGTPLYSGDITIYTDAEAIAAVEGEATLALAGDVSIANLKSLSTNTINETTAGSGVTIDSVLLKDGLVDGVDVAARDHAKYTDAEAIAAVEAEATLTLASGATVGGSPVVVDSDIGGSVQAYDAGLTSIAGLTTAADRMIYTTGSDVYAVATLTTAGRALLDDASASAQRTTLGLGSLATASTVNNGDWSGTDLSITNGGTGSSTASAARTALGLAIGSDVMAYDATMLVDADIGGSVQAYDALLTDFAGLTIAAGDIIYGVGSDNVANLAAGTNGHVLTLAAGIPSWSSPAAPGVHASSHENGGGDEISVAGLSGLLADDQHVLDSEVTAVIDADIGVGIQAYDAGLTSIAGLTTAADRMIYTTASDVYAVATLTASGRALLDDASTSAQRTTLGLAIGSDVQAHSSVLDTFAAGTDLTVAQGGTGVSSLTDHYVLVGSGTGAVTPVTPSTSGYVLTSNGTGSDPSFQAAGGGGIEEADMWRLHTGASGDTTPLTNLERVDNAEFGHLGTGMSVSSGVFTFPSTGFWFITLQATFSSDAAADIAMSANIQVTDDGSTYWGIAGIGYGNAYTTNSNFGSFGHYLFDVTSTSTHKVRFSTTSMGSNDIVGSGDNYTTMTFIKLGDT